MAENYKEILSHLNTEVDQTTLLQYLQDQLSDDKKREIEQILIDNDFESDAIDGLQNIKEKQRIALMVEMLNQDLKKRTAKKTALKQKLKLKDNTTLYVAVLIILLLITLSYFIITKMQSST